MKALETKRLILRKFEEGDFEAVHSYASCLDNIIYMPWGPNTEEDTREFINLSINQARENPRVNYNYAVVLKENNRLIGGGSIHLHKNNEAEIGWIIHKDFWKMGFGAEIGKVLVDFGFGELNLHRLIAHCDAENIGSYKVMEKIGMRKEGLFIEGRQADKSSGRKYENELSYAILNDEWQAQKEIAYYNSLPCVFEDFIDLPYLSDGEIHLVCTKKSPANPEKNWVPGYEFAICSGSEKVGNIGLRIGYGGGPFNSNLYYGGQIGYDVDEKYRGHGYAGKACKLLIPVAKAHKMEKLLITNNVTNEASRRVCEKLNLRHVRTARIPEWHDLYENGSRFNNIYEMEVI